MSEPITVFGALRHGTHYLELRGVGEAARNAQLLLEHATLGRVDVHLGGTAEVSTVEWREFGRLLCRRSRRIPTQHLLGSWEFYGHELEVGPDALIPRPDTETLVEVALAWLSDTASTVVDVGTGTGCIAIALALARPKLQLIATDLSPRALELARRNVSRHALDDRVTLVRGDLLSALDGHAQVGAVDAIVSNPPYIATMEIESLEPEVREHEPRGALDGGADGFELFDRLLTQCARWLRMGGFFACEIGHGQVDEATSRLTAASWSTNVSVTRDPGGIERVVRCRKGATR